jgi:hypothetical protein
MPYKLKGNCVVKADTGEEVKCHDDLASAQKHLAALESNVPDAKESLSEAGARHNATDKQLIGDIKVNANQIVDLATQLDDAEKGEPDNESAQPQRTGVAVPIRESASKKTRTTYLAEQVVFGEAANAQNFTVPVTLIRAGWSQNARHYSREVLARAVDKFEGVKAYADHPSKDEEKNRPERSVRDIAGYYTNVKQADDGALKADLHVIGAARDWLWPLIQETHVKPDLIGVSINALGKTSQGEIEGKRGLIVEDIVKGNSTDIVTTPAAGGKFERLTASHDGFTNDLLAAMDYDEWRDARPDFIQRLREEVKTLRQDEAMRASVAKQTALHESLTQAQEKIKALEEAQRAQEKAFADSQAQAAQRAKDFYADKLIAESKLPTHWLSAMRPQLMRETDTAQWPNIIEGERAKYLSIARPHVVGVGAQGGGLMNATPVSEALGVSLVPAPFESPDQFAARKAEYMKLQGAK